MKQEVKIPIANIIAAVRQHSAMSTAQFGEAIGVTAKQVRRYEAAESAPPQSRLKKIFHIGLKIAAPFIQQLPGYVPAILTVEAISEITEAVRRERESDKEESERIDKLATKVSEQVEAACKARDIKEGKVPSEAQQTSSGYTDIDSVTASREKLPTEDNS